MTASKKTKVFTTQNIATIGILGALATGLFFLEIPVVPHVYNLDFSNVPMMLGAFVDDEMRGAGELMEWKGQQYVRFRVGSDISYYDPDGLDETVTFRVYYRQELRYETFPQTIGFDGEAHGTLSSLFEIYN